ncbi:glutamate receptor ionotropic, kainate 4-like [Haliotis rubra]|uniref:glutamate receptor ionotropic, kainate 4-like n=1 Tax=Haliotis rubra TaxID=36100 RepID=UPI001EE5F595|nr:glutamate receptor ionotropic, kainate 4-like [Haliotis rubra]
MPIKEAYLVSDRSSVTANVNNGESVSVISISSNNTYQLWRTAGKVSSISDELSDLGVNMHMFKVGDNETELYVQLSTSYSPGTVSYYLVFCAQNCQADVLAMPEMFLMTLMFTQRGRELAMVHQFDAVGDIPSNINVFPNTEFGFNLQTFDMTTLPWNPFIIRTRQSDGQNSSYIGYTIDLLVELSRVLNFTYKFREPADDEWGRVVDGNWTGMIQMLIRNEVDIAMAPLNPTSERQAVVDFTYPMSNDFITVLFTKNDSRTEKWMTFLQPFSRPVYGLIGLSVVLATIMLTVLESYSPRTLGSRRMSSKSLQDMSWHMIGSLFAQGGDAPPSSLPGHVMMSFWWLFTFIMASVYCGNLTAFLTFSIEHPPLDGLEDLVSNSDYTYGYVGGSSYDTFFEGTTIPLYRKMGKRVKEFAQTDPSHLSKDIDVHLRKVKAGSYAFISSRILFGLWMVDNCDLTVMKENIIPTFTSIALPKHSELTKIFADA